MNPTEKRDTYIKETVKKAVDQVNSTEKKDTYVKYIRKIQGQGNQTKKKEDITKTKFDTMSLLFEFKDKLTYSQKKGNQTSEKKTIMEK